MWKTIYKIVNSLNKEDTYTAKISRESGNLDYVCRVVDIDFRGGALVLITKDSEFRIYHPNQWDQVWTEKE